MGTACRLASDEAKRVDCNSRGSVVNPSKLFTITWIVPPTEYASMSEKFSVSAQTPWPANAASHAEQSEEFSSLRRDGRRALAWRALVPRPRDRPPRDGLDWTPGAR